MNIEKKLRNWFQRRPFWIQKAAQLLIKNEQITNENYRSLYQYCLNEATNQTENLNCEIPINRLLNNKKNDGEIKLKSIENITGINALSPKNPLKFGDTNLSIIYGLNGSGKTGYVRILKHICGSRVKSPLVSDIYKQPVPKKKCVVEYQKGSESKREEWNVNGQAIDDLNCVDIFDSECGKSYIIDENQVTYEPLILSFFSKLVNVCEKISAKVKTEIEKNPSKKPSFPQEYKTTEEAKWYNEELSENTKEECLNNHCLWTENNQKELAELQDRLAQEDPKKKAEHIRKKNKHLRQLIDDTTVLLQNLSDQKCIEINKLKKERFDAENTAKTVAKQIFKQAPLDGVGNETWKRLWQYAKEYSEEIAYKEQPFPVVSDDALCVLCHQKLDEDAKSRLISFKDFIKGEAQKAVRNAEKKLKETSQSLPNVPDQRALQTKLDAIELKSDNTNIKNLYLELEKRKNQLLSSDIQSNFTALPSIDQWKNEAKNVILENEKKANQYEEDAKEMNRESLLEKQKALLARKWLSEQVNSITEEIKRLKLIKKLNLAINLTNTTSLSKMKNELSKELITKDFNDRFNTELKELKADKIKVEIIKTRTEKGKALHQIRLKGVNSQHIKIENILSEGENRIVALSAFLADMTGETHKAPFVFDDPISSLDQDFEEAVAQRLVKLSKERQVIVFTHRLSMFGLLQDYAKKETIRPDTVSVKTELWGTGEPGNIPLFAEKPDKALNILIQRLHEAKIFLKTKGKDVYENIAKSLFGDFRIIIENVIESVLLTDIVKRHRRQIHSQKIKNLTKINNNDCNFLDNLMTEYSKFLHSQSEEISVQFPDPEKLEQDFKSLKHWIKEFNTRQTNIENK